MHVQQPNAGSIRSHNHVLVHALVYPSVERVVAQEPAHAPLRLQSSPRRGVALVGALAPEQVLHPAVVAPACRL